MGSCIHSYLLNRCAISASRPFSFIHSFNVCVVDLEKQPVLIPGKHRNYSFLLYAIYDCHLSLNSFTFQRYDTCKHVPTIVVE